MGCFCRPCDPYYDRGMSTTKTIARGWTGFSSLEIPAVLTFIFCHKIPLFLARLYPSSIHHTTKIFFSCNPVLHILKTNIRALPVQWLWLAHLARPTARVYRIFSRFETNQVMAANFGYISTTWPVKNFAVLRGKIIIFGGICWNWFLLLVSRCVCGFRLRGRPEQVGGNYNQSGCPDTNSYELNVIAG